MPVIEEPISLRIQRKNLTQTTEGKWGSAKRFYPLRTPQMEFYWSIYREPPKPEELQAIKQALQDGIDEMGKGHHRFTVIDLTTEDWVVDGKVHYRVYAEIVYIPVEHSIPVS